MSLEDYIGSLSGDENRNKLVDQFQKIPSDLTQKNYTVAKLNGNKNNFNNIFSSQESRVKLLTRTGSDYINANYILDRYIATQQPNIYSHFDFWDMVYESDVGMIINLSGNNNYMSIHHQVHDKFLLEIEDLSNKDYLEIRLIKMTCKIIPDKIKRIYHITMSNWPDFGVPNKDYFCKAFDAINLIDYASNKKIIVHCRAGVGRTGTFISIHYLYRMFQNGVYPNIIDTVRDMRKSRIGMIQDKSQFLFVIDVVLNKLLEIKNKQVNLIRIKEENKYLLSESSYLSQSTEFHNKLSKSAGL